MLFISHAIVIEYFHSKSVPAFQLDQGDMVRLRVQQHLLTPSEVENVCQFNEILMVETIGFLWIFGKSGAYLETQMELEDILGL